MDRINTQAIEVSRIIIKEPDNYTLIFDKDDIAEYNLTGLNYCLYYVQVEEMRVKCRQEISIYTTKNEYLKFIYLELRDVYKRKGKRKIVCLYDILRMCLMTGDIQNINTGFNTKLNYKYKDYALYITSLGINSKLELQLIKKDE